MTLGTIRFVHTADWQIGKSYASVEEAHNRALLQQERVEVIRRIGALARQHEASFVLVAGDLFDSPTPTKSVVSAACAAIGSIELPVLAIPGNHDHAGPGSVWEQEFFERERASLAPNFRILRTPEPVEVGDAVLFPCPLLRRSESVDTTAWLRDGGAFEGAGNKVRIVLAHGSTQGFESSGDDDEFSETSNRIDLARLDQAAFDYIALGDWHGTKQVAAKAWYSGTPEIDRFPKGDLNDPGNVLLVTAGRERPCVVENLRTARFGWHRLQRCLMEDEAVERLREEIDALLENRAQQDLLRLELSGALGFHATTKLEDLLESLRARLLRLRLSNSTVLAPSEAELQALTGRVSDPLVARVAQQLSTLAAGEGESARVAQVALRELHAACRSR